jgi:hypothetical protein
MDDHLASGHGAAPHGRLDLHDHVVKAYGVVLVGCALESLRENHVQVPVRGALLLADARGGATDANTFRGDFAKDRDVAASSKLIDWRCRAESQRAEERGGTSVGENSAVLRFILLALFITERAPYQPESAFKTTVELWSHAHFAPGWNFGETQSLTRLFSNNSTYTILPRCLKVHSR